MAVEFLTSSSFHTDRRNPVRFVLSHIRRHPQYAITMMIGAFSNAALAAAVPAFVGLAFNAITGGEPFDAILWACLGIIGSQFLRAILQLMRNYSAEIFAQRIERDVRDELYASLLGKSMAFHDTRPVGEIMARVTNDVREMNLMMNPGLNLIIGSGFFLITPLFAAPLIHPALVISPAVFLVLYFLAQVRFLRVLNPIAEKVRASFGEMNAQLAEALDGLQVVKGAAREADEQAIFDARADAVSRYFIQQGFIEARYIPFLLLGIMTVAGLAHSVVLYRQGLIDAGQIVAYMGQLFLFEFPVYSSLRSLSQVALGLAASERILEVINTPTELDRNLDGYAKTLQGKITFEGVTFGYTDGRPTLRDASFEIYAGHTVALVGQTGAGKSTIAKLVNRIYDVDQGRVLIDDVDVRDWNLEALRSQISIIEQDVFLYSRSIADNIRFGKPEATLEQVESAARAAQAHDFILSFPEGYATIVGQRGITLSGGQRQRLAIARALLADTPILILDDSTSAIDSATEDRIQQAIWTAARGRTTVLITHRLSQIRYADHIIVLRNGRIAAQGTHEQLMASAESYRRIFARYESLEQPVHSPPPLASASN